MSATKAKDAEARFIEAAIRQGELRSADDANRAFDKVIAAYHEIRATPDSGRAVFRGLLWHQQPSVAGWAASFVLWDDEAAARATLKRIDESDAAPPIRMSAHMTLREWEAGRLRRPEDW